MSLCSICNEAPAQRDGLCKVCRLRTVCCRQKYCWTPELDEQLRKAYEQRGARQRAERVKALMKLTGFPQQAVHRRARCLGLAFERSPWTSEEIGFLQDHAGAMSPHRIARRLRRSPNGIRHKLWVMQLSGRVREGYAVKDIALALGTDHRRVSEWIDRGILRPRMGRVSERELRRFLAAFPELYSLKRVCEIWFKSLMFPSYGRTEGRRLKGTEQEEAA